MLNYEKKWKSKWCWNIMNIRGEYDWLIIQRLLAACAFRKIWHFLLSPINSFQIYTCICHIKWKILKKEMCVFFILSCTSHTLIVLYNLMKTHSKVFLKYIPIPVGTEHTPFWNKRHNVINSICDFCQKVSYLIYVYIYIKGK